MYFKNNLIVYIYRGTSTDWHYVHINENTTCISTLLVSWYYIYKFRISYFLPLLSLLLRNIPFEIKKHNNLRFFGLIYMYVYSQVLRWEHVRYHVLQADFWCTFGRNIQLYVGRPFLMAKFWLYNVNLINQSMHVCMLHNVWTYIICRNKLCIHIYYAHLISKRMFVVISKDFIGISQLVLSLKLLIFI